MAVTTEKTLITTTEALRRLEFAGLKTGLGTLTRLIGAGHLTEYGKPHNGSATKSGRFNHSFDVAEIDALIVGGIPRPKRHRATRRPRRPRQIDLPLTVAINDLASVVHELSAEVLSLRTAVDSLNADRERTRNGNHSE